MGDTTIDPKAFVQFAPLLLSFNVQPLVTAYFVRSLEDAMLKALPSLFPNLLGTAGSNPRVEFYEKFGREAEDHDREFTDKYDDDLDTTLIFVSAFSTPTSIVTLICFSGEIGRSVFRGRNWFHRRCPAKPPTKLPTDGLHRPRDHRQFLAWAYLS